MKPVCKTCYREECKTCYRPCYQTCYHTVQQVCCRALLSLYPFTRQQERSRHGVRVISSQDTTAIQQAGALLLIALEINRHTTPRFLDIGSRLVEGQGSLPLDDDCVMASMSCAMQPAGFEPASSE